RMNHAARDCLAANCCALEPRAVIALLDDNIAALVHQFQTDMALCRLAGSDACFTAYKTMMNPVPQHERYPRTTPVHPI
ncbi:hypothetical protein RA263_29480, partial [Pseudomonas syringae pv. tagetis]|uniref:hypothetical protein n=1 Tax=Pseudomonas syringae group genomosp. 7 TaxID=251699 RepID=UPI00376FF571